MKKIIKILDIVVYIIYALTFVLNIGAVIQTQNMAYAGTCVWIINAGTMYSLVRFQSKFGDERVKWRDETIEELFKFNKEVMEQLEETAEYMKNESKKLEEDKNYCIHYENKKTEILFAPRKPLTEKFERIDEAKKIASKLIGCEYVDGKNLEIDGQYVAGVYIDDLEAFTQRHEMVIINEIDGLDRATCEKIIEYLKEDNDFTAVLKKYELI